MLGTAAAWEENAAIFAGIDGRISGRKGSTQPGIKNTNDAHVPNLVRDQTIVHVAKPIRYAGEMLRHRSRTVTKFTWRGGGGN